MQEMCPSSSIMDRSSIQKQPLFRCDDS